MARMYDGSMDLVEAMNRLGIPVPPELVGQGYRLHFESEPIQAEDSGVHVVNVKVEQHGRRA